MTWVLVAILAALAIGGIGALVCGLAWALGIWLEYLKRGEL